ncbi:MAG: carboxymuconolactone decarboxylase family protein [Rhodocyclaceae bacterium]
MEPRLNFFKANPEAMKTLSAVEQHLARAGLEKPLMELVRLRVSQINGCAFCLDTHSADARKAGEDARRLATVAVWRETPFFSDRERAALMWAEALTRVADTRVPDELWAQVAPHFSAGEIVDLTVLVNAINGWNRLAIAFGKRPV